MAWLSKYFLPPSPDTVSYTHLDVYKRQALDPKTAAKVLSLTEELVSENNLTTLMVTHNMKDAIAIGNRLIMMNNGKVIYDVAGEEKKKLTVDDLLIKFTEASGEELSNDRMMLAK